MNIIDLLTPILDRELTFTNYFNGRLLTANDLKNDQEANKARSRQIGQALGEGIAFGLEARISKDPFNPEKPSHAVTVSAGVAMNPLGEVLNLPEDTNVAIVPEKEKIAEKNGFFAACLPSETTTILAGTGIYLLTISPVTGFVGYALMSGLGGEIRGPKGCGRSDTVEGVQFRVIELSLERLEKLSPAFLSDLSDLIAKTKDTETPDPKHISKLRNLVAHACFGTGEIRGFARDPFSSGQISGVPDSLRSKLSTLEDCEVPLALIYLTSQGIQFVDMWSVRRRGTPRSESCSGGMFVSERRIREGEAIFLQFQEHVRWLLAKEDQLKAVKSTEYFRYLPAAGVLPLGGRTAPLGFSPGSFFTGITLRDPAFMKGAAVPALLRQSFIYPPIDLSSKELIYLYRVDDNEHAFFDKTLPDVVSCRVFARGSMPFKGYARFDVSYWNYSTYA